MNVTIGMIVLNEEQYIGMNLEQHYPLADRIVIVEGADTLYPRERVSSKGLSTDRTAEIIRGFPDLDHKITFIQHGWTEGSGDQSKCELRNRYLGGEGLLIALDADEFYRRDDLSAIIQHCRNERRVSCWQFPTIHFWKSQTSIIRGGYYDVPHTRFWRVKPGDTYRDNHNHVQRGYTLLTQMRHTRHTRPPCYHFGFCKSVENMSDKTAYYLSRGEARTRPRTAESRQAWFSDELPPGLQVLPYVGRLPEVMEIPSPAAAPMNPLS